MASRSVRDGNGLRRPGCCHSFGTGHARRGPLSATGKNKDNVRNTSDLVVYNVYP